jgi:hypothetical protein
LWRSSVLYPVFNNKSYRKLKNKRWEKISFLHALFKFLVTLLKEPIYLLLSEKITRRSFWWKKEANFSNYICISYDVPQGAILSPPLCNCSYRKKKSIISKKTTIYILKLHYWWNSPRIHSFSLKQLFF